MRRRLPLNALVVAVAAAAALVLTVVRKSPDSIVGLDLKPSEVRAAPGERVAAKHDLTALKIFNLTLVRVKESYVDPARIDPQKMLYQALDSVQFNIPEVLVEPYPERDELAVMVNDKRQVFDTEDVDSPWRLAGKLKKIFRFLEANMNPGADLAEIEYAAVNGMLSTLDPHSVLMDPEAAREMDVSTSGKFGGLGIVIRMVKKQLTVIRPMKGTPAWKAGILAGDHIVKINQELTENLTSNEAVDRMRGDPKTPVTLWVERKGGTSLLRFDLVRDVIRVESVEAKLLDKNVGLIRIKQFSSSTAAETAQAMDELHAQGARSWVLDLRWNPGGLLEQAIQVSDLFVDSGTIVTTVSGREREPRRSERGPGDTSSPMAVLVNGGSASASEIVAGALKNLDRAIIIGTRTFGKGSVQVLYDNEDGSKLKLTVAQYLTPGDRSIQTLGIVPDISLQREIVPAKNDGPTDRVRMLPPSRSYGEKDLDSHLTSSYAKDTDKPAYEIEFLHVDPRAAAAAAAAPAPGTEPGAEGEEIPPGEEEPLDDELVVDFEIGLARDLVASAPSATRAGLIKGAKALLAKRRGEEDKKVADALAKLGVDWAPAVAAPGAKLTANVVAANDGKVKAGELVVLTGTVKNEGTAPAYRVHARIVADDTVFEDSELVFGKIGPGETRTFTTRVMVPRDTVDRVDRLAFEIKDANGVVVPAAPVNVRVIAAPRPMFAYAYQLIDEGNGDGLVQRKERYRLQVKIKNSGLGAAAETAALLRNASGDGVVLGKSRVEVGRLEPGATRDLEFVIDVSDKLKADEVVVEMMVYDAVLGATASETLKFPVRGGTTVAAATGVVEARKDRVEIREGAAADANLVAWAPKGARFKALGTVGPWTKVELGAGRPGFVATDVVGKASGQAGNGTVETHWQVTPPAVKLNVAKYETQSGTYSLSGTISDETHVEDVQIFVSNAGAKIDSRKVFYRSNRGNKKDRDLDFKADLPLWPGSNAITVVARENDQVRSATMFVVYREPDQTAAAHPRP